MAGVKVDGGREVSMTTKGNPMGELCQDEKLCISLQCGYTNLHMQHHDRTIHTLRSSVSSPVFRLCSM